MSVTLSPSGQLAFHRPLTQLVKRTLAVSNSNSQPVAFKVKTTAPKQYCVRPNSGRIEPGETVEVQVLLQPMKEDPAPGTKCRDKFLVQSVVITPERESTSLPDLWSFIEKEDKAAIQEQKIRCAYLPPVDNSPGSASPAPAAATALHSAAPPTAHSSPAARRDTDDEADSKFSNVREQDLSAAGGNRSTYLPTASTPPPPSSPPPNYDTPASATPSITDKLHNAVGSVSAAAASTASAVGLNHSTENKPQSSQPPAGPVGGATSNSLADADLTSQLRAAQSEIARLRSQLESSQAGNADLRHRGGTSAHKGETVSQATVAVGQPKGQDGVPIQIVAGLVFGVFVFTWLFF